LLQEWSGVALYDLSLLKVLVVDDSMLTRDLLRSLLEIVRITRVRTAADADQAWDFLKSFDPDLVITDWNMPPTSGLDFVRKVRSSQAVRLH
jgi:two-component system chemotaxis response regulator CheY